MPDKTFEYVVWLLRLALNPAEASTGTAILTAAEWQSVYRLLVKHAVVAVAWDGVERLQSKTPEQVRNMPPDLMGRWFAAVQTIEAANRRMAQQAAALQERLHNAGFVASVLKGTALAQYYPKHEHRQSADIDLWVLPQKVQRLQIHRKALIAYLQQQPDITIGEIVYHHIETTFGDTEVEMHVTPTWLYNPLHNNRLQQLFANEKQLTPDLLELYTLLHAFRHIWHDGLALRHLTDYYLVCRHNRQSAIPAPHNLYRQLGLTTFAHAVDELTALLFSDQPALRNANHLSPRAQHILQDLPVRQVSTVVRRDYPHENLFSLPWRVTHYLWRRANHYL